MSERKSTQGANEKPRSAVPGASIGGSAKAYLRAAIFENSTLKLVAFMLALTAFFLVHSDKRAVVSMTVGVSYSVPKGKVLASRPPDEVRLTVRGSLRLVKRVNERDVERIHVKLPDDDGEFVFQSNTIRLPAGLELVSINPASFPLRLERPIERSVPVRVELTESLPPGYEITGRSVEPDQVPISGAESVVKSTVYMSTMPLSLAGRVATFVEEVPLAVPEEFIDLDGASKTVRVRVEISKTLATKGLPEQPIRIVLGPNHPVDMTDKLTVDPAVAHVWLSGPELTLDTISSLRLEIRVGVAELGSGKDVEIPIFVRGLPEGVASEIRPATARVQWKQQPQD